MVLERQFQRDFLLKDARSSCWAEAEPSCKKRLSEIGNKKNTMTVIADIAKEAEGIQRNRSDDQFI